MKIAASVTRNNQIEDHFGHCEFYNIFTISEKKEVINVQVLRPEKGCGCKSGIASILAQNGVTIMLAGGIGHGAIDMLNSEEIEVIRGCSGGATEIVQQFLAGTLIDNGLSCEQHAHQQRQRNGHKCNH